MKMPRYRAFGLLIASDVRLSSLPSVRDGEVDYWFKVVTDQPLPFPQPRWVYKISHSDGSHWLCFKKIGSDLLLRFDRFADFHVIQECKEIRCYPDPGTPLKVVSQLLLDHVLPYLLFGRDQVVLHSSAVVIDGVAIAFLGASGRGKSTLCASLVKRGHKLLADDSVLIRRCDDRAYAVPSYPGIRLWGKSISALFSDKPVADPIGRNLDKYRLRAKDNKLDFADGPAPVSRIYLLDDSEPPPEKNDSEILSLSARGSFNALLGGAYRLDVTDKEKIAEEFNFLSWLSANTRVARLRFRRQFSLLPQIHRAIYNDLI